MMMISPRERAAVTKLSIRTGAGFDTMLKFLEGKRTPAPWIKREIERELGSGWEERYAQSFS
jgi:hypothetical protein